MSILYAKRHFRLSCVWHANETNMILKTLEKVYMYILFNHLMAWINDYHHPVSKKCIYKVSSFISEK